MEPIRSNRSTSKRTYSKKHNQKSKKSKKKYKEKKKHHLCDIRAPDNFPLDSFLFDLQLIEYCRAENAEEQDKILKEYDAVNLFYAIQHLELRLINIEAENMYLHDFLKVVEPQTVTKIAQRLSSMDKVTETTAKDDMSLASHQTDITSRREGRRISTVSKMLQQKHTELKINNKSKTMMCENSTNAMSREIAEMEKIAKHEVRLLGARIEELYITKQEIHDIFHNFQLAFLTTREAKQFLAATKEKQVLEKLYRFVQAFLRESKTVRDDLHIKNLSLRKRNKNLYIELLEKIDLAKLLSPVDLDLLYRKKDVSENRLDDVTTQLYGIKQISGRASSAFIRQFLQDLYFYQKKITQEIANAAQAIEYLEKHADFAEHQNSIQKKELALLHETAKLYSAPSVDRYLAMKRLEAGAIKEERLLKRKCAILDLQLMGARGRLRRETAKQKLLEELQKLEQS